MTYVSCFYHAFSGAQKVSSAGWLAGWWLRRLARAPLTPRCALPEGGCAAARPPPTPRTGPASAPLRSAPLGWEAGSARRAPGRLNTEVNRDEPRFALPPGFPGAPLGAGTGRWGDGAGGAPRPGSGARETR